MSSINRVILIGRLGQDPKCLDGQHGPMASFTLATTETWMDKKTKQKQEKTEWTRCKAFGQTAMIIENYLRQGSLVYVEGKLTTSSYDKNGVKTYSTEVLVSNVQFLDSKRSEPESVSKPAETPKTPQKGKIDDNSAYGGTSFSGNLGRPEPDNRYDMYQSQDIPF